MNGLAKKVIVYSLIGCLQFGVGATAVEAATRHDDNRQGQERRVSQEEQRRLQEQRERDRRQQEERRLQEQRERDRRQQEERRLQEQRERDRRQQEERRLQEQRERERRQHEEERRHRHEDRHDDDNTARDVGLALILLAILANSGGDEAGD